MSNLTPMGYALFWLVSDLLIITVTSIIAVRYVLNAPNSRSTLRRTFRIWIGYLGINVALWAVSFGILGYTPFGAILFGGAIAGAHALLFAVLLYVVVSFASQHQGAG